MFYEGEIAHAIDEDMRRHDGLLALEDLREWRTTRNAPLWGTYRGYRVSSNQPPGGGVMLLEMLNVLEHFDLAGLGHNSAEYVRVVAEAMKRATIDKDRHVAIPHSSTCRSLASSARSTPPPSPPRFARAEGQRAALQRRGAPSQDTTHVSVVDPEGNCVR